MIFFENFRHANHLRQQELSEILKTSQSFISSVSKQRNKLPDDKIDLIIEESIRRGWDWEPLNPTFYRLYQISSFYDFNGKEEERFDVKTCESILPIQRKELLEIKHGKIEISDEFAEKIANNLPGLNVEWIKTGLGSTFSVETEVYTEEENADDITRLISRLDRICSHINDIERRQILIDEKLNKLLGEKCK